MKKIMINAYVVTMDDLGRIYENGYLSYDQDQITGVGPMSACPPLEGYQVRDARNQLVIPGLINAHTHLGMMSFRSLADDVVDRLRLFLFPLENAYMTPELAYASAQYACAEMLLAGVTTCVDMYYFEDEIAKAVDAMGMRAYLGETIIDQPTCDAVDFHEALDHAETLLRKWQHHPLITPIIAPHAPNTNTTASLTKAHDLAVKYDTLVMMHVAEMDYEVSYYQQQYGCSPIAYLDQIGLCDQRLLAVHTIHMNDADMDILARKQARIIHCIGANTKAGKGVAPIKTALQKQIRVALGTDGASSGNTLDLFTQMKLYADIHKVHHHERGLFPAKEIVPHVTSIAADVLHAKHLIGSLEIGKKADIVGLDLNDVNMFPVFDPYSVLVYSAQPQNVRTVIVNGETLVDDKRLVKIPLSQLRTQLEAQMQDFAVSARNRLDDLTTDS